MTLEFLHLLHFLLAYPGTEMTCLVLHVPISHTVQQKVASTVQHWLKLGDDCGLSGTLVEQPAGMPGAERKRRLLPIFYKRCCCHKMIQEDGYHLSSFLFCLLAGKARDGVRFKGTDSCTVISFFLIFSPALMGPPLHRCIFWSSRCHQVLARGRLPAGVNPVGGPKVASSPFTTRNIFCVSGQ